MDTKLYLHDRPISKNRKRERDGQEMLELILEDLLITLRVLKSKKGNLDDDQIARVYACREWTYLSLLCKDVPNWKEIFYWDYTKDDEFGVKGVRTFHIENMNLDKIIEHLEIALNFLENIKLTKEDYYKLLCIYDSQWFCQITLPILENPQLANEHKKQFKLIRKKGYEKSKNEKIT